MEAKKLVLFSKTGTQKEQPRSNAGVKVKTDIKAGPIEAVEVCASA